MTGRTPWVVQALVGGWLVGIAAQPASAALIPIADTGDLYMLDHGSSSILSATPAGVLSVAATKASILAATGLSGVNFTGMGLAFDPSGTGYFAEHNSRSILKFVPSGAPPTVLVTEAAILAATGLENTRPAALAVGDDGFLYVNDKAGDVVLKVNTTTGAVTLFQSEADLLAVPGTTSVDLEGGVAAGPGVIYSGSDGSPDTVFELNQTTGAASALATGFGDLDFIARNGNGDLAVIDEGVGSGDHVKKVTTPGGTVSVLLSNAVIEAVVGGDIDLEGGLAYDDGGSLYFAEPTTALLKFDSGLSGSIFVSADAFEALTGTRPDLNGGLAFGPATPGGPGGPPPGGGVIPEPGTMLLLAVGGFAGLTTRKRS